MAWDVACVGSNDLLLYGECLRHQNSTFDSACGRDLPRHILHCTYYPARPLVTSEYG